MLKPCPFCGGKPKTRKEFSLRGIRYWETFCDNYKCEKSPKTRGRAPKLRGYELRAKAYKAWNAGEFEWPTKESAEC